MNEHQFLDKRDQNGDLLKFSGYLHAKKTTEKLMDMISYSKIYKLICTKFPKKYVDAYFCKMIHHQIRPISNQIVISNWEIQNGKSPRKTKINVGDFFMSKHLNDVIEDPKKFIFYDKTKSLKKISKDIFDKIRLIYYKFLSIKNIFLNNKVNLKEEHNSLAVCYAHGISESNRSDLFWLYGFDKNISNVILYVQYPYMLRKFKEKKIIKKLIKEKKIKLLKIWEEQNIKKKNIT